MRIIGGTHGGRLIKPPGFFKARPTTDIAKESLFNILQNKIDFENIHVLDLFSGTGSISYEFASRGAGSIISVEKDFKNHEFIKKQAAQFDFKQIRALRTDAFRYLNTNKEKFDFVFADPPYDLKELDSIPNVFYKIERLNQDGLFVLEHSSDFNFSSHARFIELRKYGRVQFSFFC